MTLSDRRRRVNADLIALIVTSFWVGLLLGVGIAHFYGDLLLWAWVLR